MIKLSSNEDCCGCYACANICPQHCIAMEEDQEGFRYPITDERRCSDCGLCERVCPVINRFAKAEYKTNVFACQNMNEQIRAESSSGGVFTLLAEPILKQNGVVFGARFDNVFAVVHDFTETIEGLEVFRGSKYVQSLIGNNYKKAEQFLKQGREVLFTGTSCQIAGLKHFLRKEYKNLLTIDVVCHGVPSPKVFSLYLKELDNMQNGRLEKIQFRDKTEGWKKYSFLS
ncbi:MAG TPA: Coenzyme F420 hydrogenase/dehydrogenase, beta subunit C-terminal domain [Paludibacter sp.]